MKERDEDPLAREDENSREKRKRRRNRALSYFFSLTAGGLLLFGAIAGYGIWLGGRKLTLEELKGLPSLESTVSLRVQGADIPCETHRNTLKDRHLYECVTVYFASTNTPEVAREHNDDTDRIYFRSKIGGGGPTEESPTAPEPTVTYGATEVLVHKRQRDSSQTGSNDANSTPEYRLANYRPAGQSRYKLTKVQIGTSEDGADEPSIAGCIKQAFLNGGAGNHPAGKADNASTCEFGEKDARLPSINEIAKDTNHSVFLFVHGMATPFDSAIAQAAEIATDTDFFISSAGANTPAFKNECAEGRGAFRCFAIGQPIVFNWRNHQAHLINKGGDFKIGYHADKELIENDRPGERLADLITDIADQGEINQINIIAHSMGNRVLLQAWNKLGASSIPDRVAIKVVLAGAEVTLDEYVSALDALDMKQKEGFARSIYSSDRDVALMLAKLLDGEPMAVVHSGLTLGNIIVNYTKVGKATKISPWGFVAGLSLSQGTRLLNHVGLSPKCRLGDLTAAECRYWKNFRIHDRRADFAEKEDPRLDLIHTPGQTGFVDIFLGYDAKDVKSFMDQLAGLGVAAKNISAGMSTFIIDHDSSVRKGRVLADQACAFGGWPAERKNNETSPQRSTIWREDKHYFVLDPKKINSNRCDAYEVRWNENVADEPFEQASPPVIWPSGSSELLLAWEYGEPRVVSGAWNFSGERSLLTDFSRFDASFLCNKIWIGVIGSASFEGTKKLNRARARWRAARAAMTLDQTLKDQGCASPPRIIAISLGQYPCSSAGPCATGASDPQSRDVTAWQRRVIAFADAEDRQPGDEARIDEQSIWATLSRVATIADVKFSEFPERDLVCVTEDFGAGLPLCEMTELKPPITNLPRVTSRRAPYTE